MATLKKIRPTARVDYYECENLFPRSDEITNEVYHREYIEGVMSELAAQKRLYLTDIKNQKPRDAQVAGMICLGQMIDPQSRNMVNGVRTTSELENYRVKVRSLNGENISWKTGMVDGDPIYKGISSPQRGPLPRAQAEYIETDSTEVDLSIYDAWKCLKWGGKHWIPAKRKELRDRFWIFEEVKPDGYAGEHKEIKTTIKQRGRIGTQARV